MFLNMVERNTWPPKSPATLSSKKKKRFHPVHPKDELARYQAIEAELPSNGIAAAQAAPPLLRREPPWPLPCNDPAEVDRRREGHGDEGEGVPVAGGGAADGDDGAAPGRAEGLGRHQVHLASQRHRHQELLYFLRHVHGVGRLLLRVHEGSFLRQRVLQGTRGRRHRALVLRSARGHGGFCEGGAAEGRAARGDRAEGRRAQGARGSGQGGGIRQLIRAVLYAPKEEEAPLK